MKIKIVVCLLLIVFAACAGRVKTGTVEIGTDDFLAMTRFIMTREEIDIYKHLPEDEKKEFIEEFWLKRDPTPGTEENENREEYKKRIGFANQWFKELPDGRGWDTDRGRILLQLGFPEERNVRVTTRRGTTWQVRIEEWYYYGYRVALRFVDESGQGRFLIDYFPEILRRALERVKFAMDLTDHKALTDQFKFKAAYKNKALVLTFPVKHIQWDEENGTMNAPFEIEIFVYCNLKQKDHLKLQKKISGKKEEIPAKKHVEIRIPYETTAAGKYSFDVIVKDPVSGSRYRNTCRYKSK